MEEDVERIAIIGLGCRFPGADDARALWQNLAAGVESVTRFTDEELRREGVAPERLADPNYVKARAVLDGVELFDADFFGYTPREAEILDPQIRLFLEVCHTALESAGYDPFAYAGRIGVYGGAASSTYLIFHLLTRPDLIEEAGGMQVKLGNDKDFLTTHVSYRLNLRGPSLAVQTACSTSLVAVHVAAQALLAGECDLALAGGVGINFPHRVGSLYQPGGILSPDGHCRAFDARSLGIVDGNGAGVVLLKRLSEAVADGDPIRAVLLGSAVNNDGAGKAGFTVPAVDSQTEVVGEALSIAGVDPATVGLVEAHGSGTPLGDPIEVQSLSRAFRTATAKRGYCALGSIKTNLGHTDAAAGVAGLLKAVLALEHGAIPPSLHFEEPNPRLGLPESPFYVPTALTSWPAGLAPRRAAVNSLGIGGTNAHVVLEEAPAPVPSGPSRPWQLLTLSAKSEAALDHRAVDLSAHLAAHAELPLADVAHTLRVGRRAFAHRAAAVCRDGDSAAAAELWAAPSPRVARGVAGEPPAVAFLFPGLGEHYAGMGAGLYAAEPVFRAAIDQAAEVLRPILGVDLRDVLYPLGAAPPPGAAPGAARPDLRRLLVAEEEGEADRRLGRTAFAHTALLAVEVGVARQLAAWGIRPAAMIGYSLGEYAAAVVAGVFSFADALALVARRALAVEALPAGAMLAVPLPEGEVLPLLAGRGLALAAADGPALSIVAGPPAEVAALAAELEGRGVACRPLRAERAFHSPAMEPAMADLLHTLAAVHLSPPAIPFVSNVTGTWITAAEATSPDYWARHLTRTVRFGDGLAALAAGAGEGRALVEVGPGRTLATLARQRPDRPAGQVEIQTVRDRREEVADQALLLDALGRLWLAGAAPDWGALAAGETRRRVALPTYPFERRRFFVEPGAGRAGSPALSPAAAAGGPTAARHPPAEGLYAPVWERAHPPAPAVLSGRWLLGGEGGPSLAALVERLRAAGAAVDVLPTGADPTRHESWEAALTELAMRGETPDRIVLLDLDPESGARGFWSLVALTQTLGGRGTGAIGVTVVTAGAVEVDGREALVPEKALVLGPVRVLPQELAGVACQVIDTEAMEPDALAARLTAELAAPATPAAPVVALRGRHRFVRAYRPLAAASSGGSERLPQGGVVLVTGVLGGAGGDAGLTIAEHFFRTRRARLALFVPVDAPPRARWGEILGSLDDTDPESRRLRRILALEAEGAEVLVAPVDLSRADRTAAGVARVVERFGRVDGVIHAAFAPGAGLLAFKRRREIEAVLRPAVTGTRHLAAALPEGVAFFLLFGSSTAATGGLGQGDTAAAAAFLAAFAQRAARSGAPLPPVQAIGWSLFAWQKITAPTPELERELAAGLARFGITAAELPAVVDRVLASPHAEAVATTQNLDALAAALDALDPGTLAPAAAPVGEHPRPALPTPYAPPQGAIEETIARAFAVAFGLAEVGRDDDFFDLAGNSLLAIQIVSRLSQELGVDLPLTSLLEAPTAATLARRAEDLRTSPQRPDPAEVERLLAEIEALSSEEAEARLLHSGAS